MHLRPELVLLQKTMMTVEGVARRIDPDLDIWGASDPVVRRWMLRELSPAARVRRLLEDATQALRNLARMAETPPAATVVVTPKSETAPWLWFALGALASAAAFLVAALA